MNLVIDLDNTLVFKDSKDELNTNLVYIDLYERPDGNLGVISRDALNLLKNFCDAKNKLVIFSNRNKVSFDNLNLKLHGISSYLDVLSFGYEIYYNNSFDFDWYSKISNLSSFYRDDIEKIKNFVTEMFSKDLFIVETYGYKFDKKILIDDFDFITYDYLKHLFSNFELVSVIEDDFSIHLVIKLFSNSDLYNYIEKVYSLDDLCSVVCNSNSFFVDLMFEFQSDGILNFHYDVYSNLDDYLLDNNCSYLIDDVVLNNIYTCNGNDINVGTEITYRIFEIFLDSL